MGTDTNTALEKAKEAEAANSSSSTESDEAMQPLPNKLKYLTAAVIFYGNVAFGCALNTYGPVATSLQSKYETDDSTISRVFTIITGFYLVGALIGGIIFNYVNRQFAVIIILTVMSAIMVLTPHCPTLTVFFISAAVMGTCCGSYDTAQFVWMMEMMQKDCPPYVQSQHFFYAVGTILVGLIMAPFLDEKDSEEKDGTTTEMPIDNSKLFIPYIIIAALVMLSVVLQVLLFIFLRYRPPPPEEEFIDDSQDTTITNDETEPPTTSDESGQISTTSRSWMWPWPKLRVVILTACFYGAYQGMEMCTFQFFPKFGQNSELKLSESESTYVFTGMTAAFAVGRGLSIIAVFKISTQLILCVNIVLVTVANVMLVAWAQNSIATLWATSILFGFGFSSMYSSFSAYIERYLNFTNFMGSLMLICGSGVAAIYPVVVGNSIEDKPVVLSYTNFFSISLIYIAFGLLSLLTHRNKTRYT